VCVEGVTHSIMRRVASCIHLRRSFCRIWGGEFLRTSRVVSSAEKEVKEGRSNSRVSRRN